MRDTIRIALAAPEGATAPPTELQILQAGDNPTRKGTVVFDETAAASVLAAFDEGGVDLPIDFDHAMAGHGGPLDRIAAGWFRPSVRAGALFAEGILWTPRASSGVAAKEWRYTSLFGDVEKLEDGRLRLVRLRTLSLTNTPATMGALPIAASEATELVEANERLAIENASLRSKLGEDKRPDTMSVEFSMMLDSMRRESALRAQVAAEKRDRLLDELTCSGKLTPAMRDWALSLSEGQLETFADLAPVVVPGIENGPTPRPNGKSVELSDEDRQMAKAFGNDPDSVLAQKRREQTAGTNAAAR